MVYPPLSKFSSWDLGQPSEFWKCRLVPPFFRGFGRLLLSQQNLGLEFGGVVL